MPQCTALIQKVTSLTGKSRRGRMYLSFLPVIIKKVKRVGAGFRKFANYRLRILLAVGGCNWSLLDPAPR